MTDEEKSHQSKITPAAATVLPAPIEVQAPTTTLSGSEWCDHFPGSHSMDDLQAPFKANFIAFYAAMEKAGCTMHISSTYRSPERSYLMYHSYQINRGKEKPTGVKAMPGVAINWDHGDDKESIAAAAAMMTPFEIDHLTTHPALRSQHNLGFAVDMNISWKGDLTIDQKDGKSKVITTEPRDRMNTDLHEVGKGYGVLKYLPLEEDKPHWSDTSK